MAAGELHQVVAGGGQTIGTGPERASLTGRGCRNCAGFPNLRIGARIATACPLRPSSGDQHQIGVLR